MHLAFQAHTLAHKLSSVVWLRKCFVFGENPHECVQMIVGNNQLEVDFYDYYYYSNVPVNAVIA